VECRAARPATALSRSARRLGWTVTWSTLHHLRYDRERGQHEARAGGSNRSVNLLVAPPCSRPGGDRLGESARCPSSPGPATSRRPLLSKTGREARPPRAGVPAAAVAGAGDHQPPSEAHSFGPRGEILGATPRT